MGFSSSTAKLFLDPNSIEIQVIVHYLRVKSKSQEGVAYIMKF